jgi:hypothetical protein
MGAPGAPGDWRSRPLEARWSREPSASAGGSFRSAGRKGFDQPSLNLAISRHSEDAAGKHFAAGVVLYDGETSASFGMGLFAVPIRTLWEM